MIMSMECPLVTVVVPVYNVREYVADCIRSVLNQTYPNIECICVDDGSTDGSSDVLDGFKDDSRMVVVRQENGGVSVARNRALELARGDYITFLDADDLFCADFIEKAMADFAADPSLDLWVGQVVKVDENDVPFKYQPGRPPACDTGNVLDDFLHLPGRHYLFSICPKVYRAAVIRENGIRFRVGMKNGEDSLFVTKVYSFARKGRITNAEVYRRRMRGGSAVGTPWASHVPDSLEAIVDLIEFARQSSSPDSVYRAVAQRALARLRILFSRGYPFDFLSDYLRTLCRHHLFRPAVCWPILIWAPWKFRLPGLVLWLLPKRWTETVILLVLRGVVKMRGDK